MSEQNPPVSNASKLIKVIPISKTIGIENLSYFTSRDLAIGSIVTVPVRKKLLPAIVTEIQDASEARTELRQANFEIKKLAKVGAREGLAEALIQACKNVAADLACSTGAVINTAIAPVILEKLSKDKIKNAHRELTEVVRADAEQFVIQSDDEERLSHYKSLIREEFAKKSSVFLCLPTSYEAQAMYEVLERGIKHFVFLLHSGLPKKDFVITWDKLRSETHPVLIIGTANFIAVPRNDIGTIIFEKESSKSYMSQARPYLDFRKLAEAYAKESKIRLILGDSFLRTETIWRTKEGELVEYTPLKFRSLTTANTKLVDLKRKSDGTEKAFSILSDELIKLIEQSRANNNRIFIFAARRGLSPQTVCSDCGTVVMCEHCNAPVILYASARSNFFLCHRCGTKRSAEETCKNCESWRLKPLGIGVDRVEAEISEKFPGAKIFKITKDKTKTQKQAAEVAKKFYATAGGILVGTEMALTFLDQKIESCAVASLDALFSIPDFRIDERVFQILLKLRALSTENFLVQTRSPEKKLFEYALSGNTIDFYKDEIELRKSFGYPPFTILARLSLRGTKDYALKEMKRFETDFAKFNPAIFPAFVAIVNGKHVMNALIRVSKENWPFVELLDQLRTLPPSWSIVVNPENLI